MSELILSKEESTICNLCGNEKAEFLFSLKSCNIVKCRNCGLIFIDPRTITDDLVANYEGNYSQGYIAKAVSKRKRADRKVKRLFKMKKQGRFLDIGCSAGFILEAARKRGFETYGVEISPLALQYAKEELRLNVFDGFLDEARFPDHYFDVITMYEVIEHVPDPTRFLLEVRRIIKEDGIIELSTPNIGHRKAKKEKEGWEAVIVDHLYYYTMDTLDRMLKKTGFYIFKKQFTLKPGLKVYVKPLPTKK